jgi:hypothetical protein
MSVPYYKKCLFVYKEAILFISHLKTLIMKTLLSTLALLVMLLTGCKKTISTPPAQDDVYSDWLNYTNPTFSGNLNGDSILWQLDGPSDHIVISGFEPYGNIDTGNSYRVLLCGVESHDVSEYAKIYTPVYKKKSLSDFESFLSVDNKILGNYGTDYFFEIMYKGKRFNSDPSLPAKFYIQKIEAYINPLSQLVLRIWFTIDATLKDPLGNNTVELTNGRFIGEFSGYE